MSTADPFKRLAKLLVRAFYDGEEPPKEVNKKNDKADNRGNAIVVLDALTRRQWIKEDELAIQLHLHPKQVRKTLRVLEEDRLVVRETRKENAKILHKLRMAVAAQTGEKVTDDQEVVEKIKQREYSYCALDYGQLYDVVRYRLMKAKKKIKDELEDKDLVQEYVCPNESCKRIYSALDVGKLLDQISMTLVCEHCQTEVDLVTRHLHLGQEGIQESAAGDVDLDRKTRRSKLRLLLEAMEKQLKPLEDQLMKVRDLQPPTYQSLSEWEVKATPQQRAAAMGLESHFFGTSWGRPQSSSTPMPFVGETQVEVNIGGDGDNKGQADSHANEAKQPKVLPSWVFTDQSQAADALKVEPKAEAEEDKSNVKSEAVSSADELAEQQRLAEYYKAYYAAIESQQSEAVSVKAEAKQEAVEYEEGEEDNVEWEDEPVAAVEGQVQDDTKGDEMEDFEWEGGDVDFPSQEMEDLLKPSQESELKDDDDGSEGFEWDEG